MKIRRHLYPVFKKILGCFCLFACDSYVVSMSVCALFIVFDFEFVTGPVTVRIPV